MWAKAAQNSFQKACRIMLCNLHKSLPRAHRICTSQNLWVLNRSADPRPAGISVVDSVAQPCEDTVESSDGFSSS